mmetsp:Transcript_24145/g.53527  ORF Transcript_24145/g.53527 Transcript_24145/m.53527 type:complete len:278 (+) Transcript_24145:818-1651(+)
MEGLHMSWVEREAMLAILQSCIRPLQFEAHQGPVGPGRRVVSLEAQTSRVVRLGLIVVFGIEGLVALLFLRVCHVGPMSLRHVWGQVPNRSAGLGLSLLLPEFLEVSLSGLFCLLLFTLQFCFESIHVDLIPGRVVVLHRRLVPGILVPGLLILGLASLLSHLVVQRQSCQNRLLATDRRSYPRGVAVPNHVRILLSRTPDGRIRLLDVRLPAEKLLGDLIHLLIRSTLRVEEVELLGGNLQQLVPAGVEQVFEVAAVVLNELDVPFQYLLVPAFPN